ncbi:uncharacterized protein K02A2.6-like [Uloborus diversus]|uniref:uncharacterized protein K02A2.6-like n=1 Tax=Uloborus diversus TaxID=327109 RepID=UPI00240A712B|nr:uncharacterized protein K02A2.6-like [Uloborus diversus]
MVSDNGPQFTSSEFEVFARNNGIKHRTCAPFKPSSNGQAERYVYTVKQALRAMQSHPGNINQKLSTFLMNYRKAPNLTTLQSPAMLFLKREIRTRIDLVRPNLKQRVEDRIRKDSYHFKDRSFEIGDRVAIRDYRSANRRWKIGTVINKDGVLHYTIDVQGTLIRRHIDQMRAVGSEVQSSPVIYEPYVAATSKDVNPEPRSVVNDFSKETEVSPTTPARPGTLVVSRNTIPTPPVNQDLDSHQPELRRSTRIRKTPQRLDL